MYFDWNEEKNAQIKQERGIGFEDFLQAVEEGRVLDIIEHHQPDKYPNQKLFVANINDYICYIPFVKDEEKYFLKNIIPSRKLNKLYKKGHS